MADGVALRIAGRTEPTVVLAASGQAEAAAGLGAPVLAHRCRDPRGAAPATRSRRPRSWPRGPRRDRVHERHHERPQGRRADPRPGDPQRADDRPDRHGPAPDRGLGIIPLSHMYGQIVPLFLCLISGSTLVFAHALTPTGIGATLRREHITAITAVPQLAQLLLDGIEAEATRQGRRASCSAPGGIARPLPMSPRRRLFRAGARRLGRPSGGHHLRRRVPDARAAGGVGAVRRARGPGVRRHRVRGDRRAHARQPASWHRRARARRPGGADRRTASCWYAARP